MAKRTCVEDGCDNPAIARGWCRPHYSRWYEAKRIRGATLEKPCKGCGQSIPRTSAIGPIPDYCTPDCRPRCSIDGCEKPRHGLTYCSAHHARWKRCGDPLAPLVRHENVGSCSVDGCETPMRKAEMCADHYGMFRRYGEIRDWTYRWGEGGYGPVHRSLQRLRGKAADHPCADCEDQAQEWSYDGDDPDEITDERGRRFTRNPDAYSPRCVRCHRRFDENPIAMRT